MWRSFVDHPGCLYLYEGAWQLGGYDVASGTYRPLLDYERGVWGEPGPPPVALPAGYERRELNFGVDRSKLGARNARYRLNGRDISREEALRVIENALPDDAGKLRLTVIGSDSERAAVLAELEREADMRGHVNVWSVPPDHWSLKDNVTGQLAYVNTGHPTVYLQAPDGKVLHRQDDFRPGDIAVLRKASAGYDPRRDPDLRRALPSPFRMPLQLLLGGGAGIAAVLLVQHFRGRIRNLDSLFRS